MANFNANDPNNPLMRLLAGRNLYGQSGRNLNTGAQESLRGLYGYDISPEYFEEYLQSGSEGGGGERAWRLRPEFSDELQGMVQIGERGLDIGGGEGNVIDPSLVRWSDRFGLVTPPWNIRQPNRNTELWWAAMMAPAAFGAISSINGAGAAGLGEGATGAFDMGGSAGVFDSFGNPLYNPELLAASGPPDAYWNMVAENGGGSLTDATTGGLEFGPGGGLDPETLSGMGGMGVGQNGIGPGSWSEILSGTMNNPTSLLGRAGDALTGAGQWAMGNPLQALRGAAGLAATISGLRTPGGGGGGDGGGGGTGDVSDMLELMANANRFDHVTPFGSRQWSRGADGRWTVTDSLNPGEQQNYEQIQGMNLGVTGMAQQRLAALLAGTGRQRADRPLLFNGRTIGG